MKNVSMLAGWVLVVAGLNTGLMALTGADVLGSVVGAGTTVAGLWNLLVGASALVVAYKMMGMKA